MTRDKDMKRYYTWRTDDRGNPIDAHENVVILARSKKKAEEHIRHTRGLKLVGGKWCDKDGNQWAIMFGGFEK